MNDIVDIRVLLEHLIQGLLIGDVERVVLGSLAADQLDAVQDLLGGVVEVVDDDDLVVGLEESERGERADVAGATGEETGVSGVTIVLWGLSKTVADRALAVDSVLNGGGGDVANGRLPGDENRADNHVERARGV